MRQADPIDAHVGRRMRERRSMLGMSQERLGELLGVSFQQVQKYERGVSRLAPSKLHQIAGILAVPVAFFFDDDLEEARGPADDAEYLGLAEDEARFVWPSTPPPPRANRNISPAHRDILDLVRAFQRIEDPAVRQRVSELVRALAAATYGGSARTHVEALTEHMHIAL